VNGRRDSGVRTEDGVGQFEEGVAPTVEAFVERAAETVESIGTFHDAPIMHSPTTLRIPYLPVELKRKLRAGAIRRFRLATLPVVFTSSDLVCSIASLPKLPPAAALGADWRCRAARRPPR
jgi:hypothetical protein